jgi:CRISPR-associated protein Cas2
VYVILAYDVGEDRVGKVCRFLRRYLPRVQNSVFEGELSEAKLARMKAGLEKILQAERDSALLWVMRDDRWVDRQIMGKEKLPVSAFL